MRYFDWIRRHNLEVQFWGYETGNIIAAITGAGGFAAFFGDLGDAFDARGLSVWAAYLWLAQQHPEAFATMGVIGLVVVAFPLTKFVRKRFGPMAADAVNGLAVPLALALLAYALIREAHFFTVSACAFVVASCFLRGAGHYPVLLKLGGLMLTVGGLALAAAGVSVLSTGSFGDTWSAGALSLATTITGFFVAGAGLLTYHGGCFAVAGAQREAGPVNGGLLASFLAPHGPVQAVFARTLDPIAGPVVRRVVCPALFWIPAQVKSDMPFRTSMLARLPWRIVCGVLALLSGTAAGLAFAIANGLWALGDVAIGSLDSTVRTGAAKDNGRVPAESSHQVA